MFLIAGPSRGRMAVPAIDAQLAGMVPVTEKNGLGPPDADPIPVR